MNRLEIGSENNLCLPRKAHPVLGDIAALPRRAAQLSDLKLASKPQRAQLHQSKGTQLPGPAITRLKIRYHRMAEN
eukprot:1161026-Pelagomonas_calceolata.AAC.8